MVIHYTLATKPEQSVKEWTNFRGGRSGNLSGWYFACYIFRGMRYFLMLGTICGACVGQSISIGVMGGGRPTDDVTCCAATPESRRYVVCPMVELGLPLGFAVEFDALYHRHRYQIPLYNLLSAGIQSERPNF